MKGWYPLPKRGTRRKKNKRARNYRWWILTLDNRRACRSAPNSTRTINVSVRLFCARNGLPMPWPVPSSRGRLLMMYPFTKPCGSLQRTKHSMLLDSLEGHSYPTNVTGELSRHYIHLRNQQDMGNMNNISAVLGSCNTLMRLARLLHWGQLFLSDVPGSPSVGPSSKVESHWYRWD